MPPLPPPNGCCSAVNSLNDRIMSLILIFFLSTRPYLHSPGPDFALKDKVAHTTEYLVLGVLLYTGVGWFMGRRPRFLMFWILFAIGASLAAADEMLQTFVPGRTTDIHDWLADTVGVALGVISAMLVFGGASEDSEDKVKRGGETA